MERVDPNAFFPERVEVNALHLTGTPLEVVAAVPSGDIERRNGQRNPAPTGTSAPTSIPDDAAQHLPHLKAG